VLTKEYGLDVAERDGTLQFAGGTYSAENDAVYDGLSRQGIRIVTFGPVLRNRTFPLPQILELLLDMGPWGMGTPVEIEFAGNLPGGERTAMEFGMLQMRPLVVYREQDQLNVEDFDREKLLCQSDQVLGNGLIEDIRDAVVVDFNTFDRARSREVAREVSMFNTKLVGENRPYLLVGVGRWGSLDPWLGIPVTWDQIAGAKAIVETEFREMSVTPSQGSHFFQNITSFMVGYFTVNVHARQGYLDWDWLLAQAPVEQFTFTRHIRFAGPLTIRINGHSNKGVILKAENVLAKPGA
jgi:hypothetical protein